MEGSRLLHQLHKYNNGVMSCITFLDVFFPLEKSTDVRQKL